MHCVNLRRGPLAPSSVFVVARADRDRVRVLERGFGRGGNGAVQGSELRKEVVV